jgi:hypothetical protein
VRDINTIGPGSTTHDPFPLDTQHIDYLHFACRRVDFRNTLEVDYDFEFRISNWDDGNYGKSIQRKGEDECGLAKWKYEPETTGLRFHDGTVSE